MWMTLFEFNRGAIAAKHAKEYLATFEFAGKEFGEDVKAVLAKIDEEAAKAEKGDDDKAARKPARKPAARRPRKTADGELAEKMGDEAPAKKAAPRKRAVKKVEAAAE
jgi:hypothetical protein